ncbi:hypothetical protein FHS43_002877 [Streptosporangium becharense]|uniref:DUF397 domain-containing protein n=1 Tax=Streptosporangium becharense TaxID=1816182 RepID=A0A7W9ILZ6_9ACTN|nr:DUF397 domain-containing protein [Streptosporangium becharense]MBB2911604.1 hypothetical protein [Streptosporangium becharense]MBB5822578.1 hypothetical protein [Streptosporangium becharense]
MDLSGARWRKSGRSTGGDCVEVAVVPGDPALARHKADADQLYLVRDSKDPDGPALAFTRSEWVAFVGGVKDGEFD